MRKVSLEQYSQEQLREMSFVELAYLLLCEKKQTVSFQEMIEQLVAIKGLSESEVSARLAQFYTDLNVDGRFICVGETAWGLRSWYPYDQTEDEAVPVERVKKKKKVADDFDDFDDMVDEDELVYDDLDEELLGDEELLDDDFALDEDEEVIDDLLDEELDLDDEPIDEELDVVDEELEDEELELEEDEEL
ncbi:DNA-directed RNA polymerase delta subunit [Anoxybacillus flavithermus]|uniref:Probable DNA-directed RNA polymerase subunit delta n=1 Tax=Anoxybacillus flavithermus TaxID=33934 RepID=A0A178TDG8_9BACL|nr:DNA-directed RNA polymerase delta subunit [Anoxybacillus flavithermus]OAO79893.1 DNA-directed RNA polymerase delta subunit [Anoxybacillus flavithermus]